MFYDKMILVVIRFFYFDYRGQEKEKFDEIEIYLEMLNWGLEKGKYF